MVKRFLIPFAAFLLGSTFIASFYIGILTWAQGWAYTSSQFVRDRWYVIPIILGFAVQAALYSILRFRLFIPVTSTGRAGSMMGASGGTSATAMVACCIHHVTDVLPILGLSAAASFLILGSASPELLRQSSESLAGRISIIQMSGFSLEEVGAESQNLLWWRGGYPLSFTASNDDTSLEWRKDFVLTFLERDIPQFGFNIPSTSLFRFWSLLAHYHGQVWNAAEAARTLSVGETTARRYIDLLQNLFMVRLLQPWYANLGKRQVKTPKVYIRDTGLLHYLSGIRTERELLLHRRSGASWKVLSLKKSLKPQHQMMFIFGQPTRGQNSTCS